ncbi:GspE/PulE family protein [Thalassoglobus sp.]|uniref:GspE/PulE family protein n=1 Tax=Thalassoglobus sp. TaxID=2795869 RepID=UPI003AA87CB0
MTLNEELRSLLAPFQVGEEKYAVHAVEVLLDMAIRRQASDLHLIPDKTPNGLIPYFRIDGVLEAADRIDGGVNIVTRLKVVANLLTYRTDVPQEGRVKGESTESEIRVSTFPTVHGEKAVVRFFVGSGEYRTLEELGYVPEIENSIRNVLEQTSGLLLTCGPAGSGKTTMLYAAIRHILTTSVSLRSICTLEDPVEAILPGISQSAIKPESDFNYERGLISLMRQDPDVIMVGEIRDKQTAGIVFQASLTGHLVLSTFHAGTAAAALGRLADMKIEPYILRSGLSALLAQRLLRKSCRCRQTKVSPCQECRMTGYSGRIVVAEMLRIEHSEITNAILEKKDVPFLERAALSSGMIPMLQQAQRMVESGQTTTEECYRVFGSDALPG